MVTEPPSHGRAREIAQTTAEIIVNLVPSVGGSAAVALTAALNYRLNKRRERWFTELAERVEVLGERVAGFDPEALADNEAFVDAVVTATRIVDRTSQHEKIDALRNAVLNSALPGAPDQDLQQLYLTLVDDLTPTHLRLLAVLNDPEGWFERTGLPRPRFGMTSNRMTMVRAAMPELSDEPQEVIERFHAGLADGGLVNASLGGVMTGSGAWGRATTRYAEGFLAFIRDPAPLDG